MKNKLHPRNKHKGRYDFQTLMKCNADLTPFVLMTEKNKARIDFSNPQAVRQLNKALLNQYYNIEKWHLPKGYLCPPIPGRADYIHHIADLLASLNKKKIPRGKNFRCLDVGVGANCIYPIIGLKEYGWKLIGSEIDSKAIAVASQTIDANPSLQQNIELRLQSNSQNIFQGIIQSNEYIDLTICNPPFYTSAEEAAKSNLRKVKNLKTKAALNFGGQSNELWYNGGEKKFIQTMIQESIMYQQNCFVFSTLVSRESKLPAIYKTLENAKASWIKTIPMGQGNKISRIVAWTFLNQKQQEVWAVARWC